MSTIPLTHQISGLSPNAEHGFHVHQFGDISGGCNSTGGHFNPFNKTHGAPDAKIRHVGDLGNIKTDANGTATVDIKGGCCCGFGQFGLRIWGGPCEVAVSSGACHAQEARRSTAPVRAAATPFPWHPSAFWGHPRDRR